jgi:hypothetical protein
MQVKEVIFRLHLPHSTLCTLKLIIYLYFDQYASIGRENEMKLGSDSYFALKIND